MPDPTEQETVISQLHGTLVGAGSPFHYLVQFVTALLLVLAANTAFADFPRLASILGKDRFLPRQFQFRGDRLAFTSGSWCWPSWPRCWWLPSGAASPA